MTWLSQHIGGLPTWLAAIGAIVAARFAFGQLKALRVQNELQQRDLDNQASEIARVEEAQRKQLELLDLEIRDRRAAQARLVEVRRYVDPWEEPGNSVVNGFALIITVTNNSSVLSATLMRSSPTAMKHREEGSTVSARASKSLSQVSWNFSDGGPPPETRHEVGVGRLPRHIPTSKGTAVNKNYQTTKIDTTRTAVPEQVSALAETTTDLRDGLLALPVGAGLRVLTAMMEADVAPT